MNKLNTTLLVLGLLVSFSSTFAMERIKEANNSENEETVKGDIFIIPNSITYQCGSCEYDLKNNGNFLLPFNPADPLIEVRVHSPETDNWSCYPHPKVGSFPDYLPYCVFANKKENDIVRLFNTKKKCVVEFTCKQLTSKYSYLGTFEKALNDLKKDFLGHMSSWLRCSKTLGDLKIIAEDGYNHGPYGFGKVPGSLKDTCIKYIFFNKEKLTAEQQAQIKLLPEELRTEIEPVAKNEQKP
jgi:hypothetical protein